MHQDAQHHWTCAACSLQEQGNEGRPHHMLDVRGVDAAAGAVGAHQHHALVVAQGRRQERLRRQDQEQSSSRPHLRPF